MNRIGFARGSGILGRMGVAATPIIVGGIAASGFAPLGLWPLTLAALAWLLARLAQIEGNGWRQPLRAAGLGWGFGLGLFTVGFNWIAAAFGFQDKMPVVLGWVAVVALAAWCAVWPALACAGAAALARGHRAALVWALAGCWVAGEWGRATAFTGFAWNPLAAVTLGSDDRPGLAMLAAWSGTYALSGLVVLAAGLWLVAWRAAMSSKRGVAVLAAALPLAAWLAPWHGDNRTAALAYTVVQPDIGQDTIDQPALYEQHFQRLAALSRPLHPGQRRIVVWPEGIIPDYLRPGYPRLWYAYATWHADPAAARARLGRAVGPDSLLLAGAQDLAFAGTEPIAAWNVVTALDGTGAIRGSYAKAHLVPYGEYLPARDWLGALGLQRVVAGDIDYRPGPGPQTLPLAPWGRIGVLICYEVIFSGEIVDRAHRPDVLINPSIDGWYGAWGPPQHLAQARLRAIEEGLPILRSTTNGVSAVIDARGGLHGTVARHVAGRLDGLVPAPLPPPPFARLGHAVTLGVVIALVVLALVVRRRVPR